MEQQLSTLVTDNLLNSFLFLNYTAGPNGLGNPCHIFDLHPLNVLDYSWSLQILSVSINI